MKIFLSLNNYWGANVWGSRFLNKLGSHDVKVAAYYKNHKALNNFDWCLDSLFTKDKKEDNEISSLFPKLDAKKIGLVLNELIEWEPDLIISDAEIVSATLALTLEVPLWYCSPLLLFRGIDWSNKSRQLKFLFKKIDKLPTANRNLIYSPFGDLSNCTSINDGFEWVKPYHEEPNNNSSDIMIRDSIGFKHLEKIAPPVYSVISGETSYLSDALYLNRPVVVTANPDDIEQVMNAELAEIYKVGINACGVNKSAQIAEGYSFTDRHIPLTVNLKPELHTLLEV